MDGEYDFAFASLGHVAEQAKFEISARRDIFFVLSNNLGPFLAVLPIGGDPFFKW